VFTDTLEFYVGEILDLFGKGHTSSFTNFARASATDAKNGGQADLGVLMWRNVDASNTGHDCSLMY
jgi:hypothetical protein